MYIKKIDDLFDNNKFNKHFCYKNQKISYIDKNNVTKRYNIFVILIKTMLQKDIIFLLTMTQIK